MIGIFDTLVNSICEASLQKKPQNDLLYLHGMALDKVDNFFLLDYIGFWIFIKADNI